MIRILCLILKIFCDNIEINTNEFKKLIIGNNKIHSSELKNCNSVKISFQGTTLYSLRSLQPDVLELIDSTVYLSGMPRSNIRLDFEYKIFGLADFAWRFIISLIIIGTVFTFIVQRMLKKTFVRKLIGGSTKF